MIMIVGLGNLGKEYEKTRHNAGFMAIDYLAKLPEFSGDSGRGIDFKLDKKFKAYIGRGKAHGKEVILVKPTTFMNLSGEAVKQLAHYYKIENKDVWVICDDINLPLGTVRIRQKGSDGGHNGLASIVENMGTDEFVRIRIGIGEFTEEGASEEVPHEEPRAEVYVLEKFNKRELVVLEKIINMTGQKIIEGIRHYQLDSETISGI